MCCQRELAHGLKNRDLRLEGRRRQLGVRGLRTGQLPTNSSSVLDRLFQDMSQHLDGYAAALTLAAPDVLPLAPETRNLPKKLSHLMVRFAQISLCVGHDPDTPTETSWREFREKVQRGHRCGNILC
jgi:hypothetical protein